MVSVADKTARFILDNKEEIKAVSSRFLSKPKQHRSDQVRTVSPIVSREFLVDYLV